MTTECLVAAWNARLPAAEKLVLMFIADSVDYEQEYELTALRVRAIAEFADLSERQVLVAIEGLAKELKVVYGPNGRYSSVILIK